MNKKHSLPITTPGQGLTTAQIMLIGEAPGAKEEEQGIPFVGRSGQLLRKTLQDLNDSNLNFNSDSDINSNNDSSIDSNTSIFHPDNLYITNIVKFRPPENRDPTKLEIAAYKPLLDQEINTVNPKLIITLGRFSMAKFLPKVKISQVHGQLHQVDWEKDVSKVGATKDYSSTTPAVTTTLHILPMYHPAAALRSTKVKNAFIDDFKKVSKIINEIKR